MSYSLNFAVLLWLPLREGARLGYRDNNGGYKDNDAAVQVVERLPQLRGVFSAGCKKGCGWMKLDRTMHLILIVSSVAAPASVVTQVAAEVSTHQKWSTTNGPGAHSSLLHHAQPPFGNLL